MAAALLVAPAGDTQPQGGPAGLTAGDLTGTWAGTATHDGESQPLALDLGPGEGGRVPVSLSVPITYLDHVMLGRPMLTVHGDSVRLGPFAFIYDRESGTLEGTMPAAFVPVYSIPIRLKKTARFDLPSRAPLAVPEARPRWTFDAGSPIWAGPTVAGGLVYAGTQAGWIYALDERGGARRWAYRAGGPVRTRPVMAKGALYAQSDDGFLNALEAKSGKLRWRVRINRRPIERLPFSNPASRFDRFGSDVTVAAGRLYVGMHEGRVLAIDASSGRIVWEFGAGDAVLSAPAVSDGRVLFGSYDHFVYALEAATGRLLWKRDTQGAVVSTPAIAGDIAVIGNRCYDLLGLDVRSGDVVWKRYVWMSWVESSASIVDSVAYVGSSDAVAVYAFNARDGRRLWASDVHGWAWGQPAVSDGRVYMGTSGQVGYPVRHEGAMLALDRASGAALWRYSVAPPDSGAFGFPGSPALGPGGVFAGGLDGHVYAFAR